MGAAGAAIGGFMQMTHRNFGYDPAHVMSVPVPLYQHSYLTREARATYFKTLQEKIAAVPGVTRVALSANATPPHNGDNLTFEILGIPSAQRQYLRANFIHPEYFSTLHIPLLQGRLWNRSGKYPRRGNRRDQSNARPPILSQQRRHRTADSDAHAHPPNWRSGQLVGVPDTNGWLEVIGVVADSLNDGLDKPVQPALYMPYPRSCGWIPSSLSARRAPAGHTP